MRGICPCSGSTPADNDDDGNRWLVKSSVMTGRAYDLRKPSIRMPLISAWPINKGAGVA